MLCKGSPLWVGASQIPSTHFTCMIDKSCATLQMLHLVMQSPPASCYVVPLALQLMNWKKAGKKKVFPLEIKVRAFLSPQFLLDVEIQQSVFPNLTPPLTSSSGMALVKALTMGWWPATGVPAGIWITPCPGIEVPFFRNIPTEFPKIILE